MKRLSPFVIALLWILSGVARAGVGTWTTHGPPAGASSVVVDPAGILYAQRAYNSPDNLTSVEGPLWKSPDGGNTWQQLGISARPLAAGPPGTIYAGSITYGDNLSFVGTLYKSGDGGATSVSLIQKPQTSFSLVIDPFEPSTLFRIDAMYASLTSSLWRSTDGGSSWTEVDQGIAEPHPIVAFVADPQTPHVFYASVGIYETPAHGGRIYRTSDGGSSWTLVTELFGVATTLAVDPFSSSTLYAVITDSYDGGRNGTWKSVDGGATFQRIHYAGLDLATDPVRRNHLYVAIYAGVLSSSDGGSTFIPMSEGLPAAAVLQLAIDPHGQFLHAAVGTGVFDLKIAQPTCSTNPRTLCLNDGRFEVTADFQSTPTGPSAPATAVPLTADTGYFWFFDPTNVEMVAKVLNGCSVNGSYWVFASGLTNVGVQINVTDTLTGAAKPFSNPTGSAFEPIQDTAAFPCP